MTETEVKIRWTKSPSEARLHIERSGFRLIEPRTLERDQLFDRLINDNSNGELKQSGRALRLRLTYIGDTNIQVLSGTPTRATLTYKGPQFLSSDPQKQGRYKSREEIECHVSDGEAFGLVLSRLGYQPEFLYEKYRTKFAGNFEPHNSEAISNDNHTGIVTIDETPIGVFLELEGPEYWIEDTAQRLGLASSPYITTSYPALYREYRQDHPETPVNMTFSREKSGNP